ncbi:hypothetical protein [uncultured Desulfovibrio sp.]|uniref:hypothetical protein n=1 Tax=uncultured Desulfovibrio sp. TaxID=167968 RepID=UPI00261E34CA|nr:hypothetical protein [uncultured Desulfovibrio sp.]
MTAEIISPRTAIRRAACEVLRAALPGWAEGFQPESVYDSLTVPLGMKKLPAILVYTRDERLDEDGHADPGIRSRTLELAVEVVTGADAATDFLCTAVEAVMDAHETLGNLVRGTRLQRISVDRDSDGERIVVAARMDFEVAYFTRPVVASTSDAGTGNGVAGIPPYPEDASAIIGMTPTLAELEDGGGVAGSGNGGRSMQILTSTAPFIGPGYEPYYEPAQTS